MQEGAGHDAWVAVQGEGLQAVPEPLEGEFLVCGVYGDGWGMGDVDGSVL